MARTTRDSVAILTGSARNIGLAIALELTASGVVWQFL
jgi:NAD(P)-dependent dehydrogenase (short-subunit alcohol dehydrogenase family)